MAKILIVDDEAGVLAVTSKFLALEGHDTTQVSESETVEKLLDAESFDLMITDLRMHPVNGHELLKMAKKKYADMPVIIMTAFHTAGLMQQCLDDGAVACVSKPFELKNLLKEVQKALAPASPC